MLVDWRGIHLRCDSRLARPLRRWIIIDAAKIKSLFKQLNDVWLPSFPFMDEVNGYVENGNFIKKAHKELKATGLLHGLPSEPVGELNFEDERRELELVRNFLLRHIRSALTPLQKSVLDALDGRALKVEDLQHECRVDRPRLYYGNKKRDCGLIELRDMGLVAHKRPIGYYRPDAPPS